jgi:cupin fold WbuC family metalloprotein
MANARLRRFDGGSLRETVARAASSPRRRANLNVHPALDDPVQRMLNVFQPGTYVRAHRHEPDRFELFLALSGRAAVLTFDDAGHVLEVVALEPGATWAVELPGDVWHTVVSLAEDTALFEVKPGPYRPLEDKDYAPWAPREGTPDAQSMLAQWRGSIAAADGAPGTVRAR